MGYDRNFHELKCKPCICIDKKFHEFKQKSCICVAVQLEAIVIEMVQQKSCICVAMQPEAIVIEMLNLKVLALPCSGLNHSH